MIDLSYAAGSWVQVIDEPDWPQPETLTNTLTLMKLYKSVDPRIKIYQTRWPDGGGADSDIAHTAAAISRGTTELRTVPSSCLPLLELVDWSHVLAPSRWHRPLELFQPTKRHDSTGAACVQPLGSSLAKHLAKHSSSVSDGQPPHERWLAHAKPVPIVEKSGGGGVGDGDAGGEAGGGLGGDGGGEGAGTEYRNSCWPGEPTSGSVHRRARKTRE